MLGIKTKLTIIPTFIQKELHKTIKKTLFVMKAQSLSIDQFCKYNHVIELIKK